MTHEVTKTAEEMDDVLSRISSAVGSVPDRLAVTVASRVSPWATLASTLLSLRARDEQTAVATPRLLAAAPTPQAMVALSEAEVQRLIYPISFYRTKSRTLLGVARTLLDLHGGEVPDTLDGLLSLKGVGRKSANLVLTLGFGKSGLCVDTHVHRLSNRLGFVRTRNPEKTEFALRETLPARWWTDINGALIAFGRSQCTPVSPKCSTCPVSGLCPRTGVDKSR